MTKGERHGGQLELGILAGHPAWVDREGQEKQMVLASHPLTPLARGRTGRIPL